ncbi:MAG: Uma2 family endonuclease [Dehalococcoidia bacterium]
MAEYYRMAAAGILRPDERVELIEGEIVVMAPISSRHAAAVRWLARWAEREAGDRAVVSVQSPVRLSARSEPEPDIALLLPRADLYANAHPGAAEILLIIEVAHTSLAYDRRRKIPMYAQAGVPETWLLDLERRVIIIFRHPAGRRYLESQVIGLDETVAPHALPNLTLHLRDLFGALRPEEA